MSEGAVAAGRRFFRGPIKSCLSTVHASFSFCVQRSRKGGFGLKKKKLFLLGGARRLGSGPLIAPEGYAVLEQGQGRIPLGLKEEA